MSVVRTPEQHREQHPEQHPEQHRGEPPATTWAARARTRRSRRAAAVVTGALFLVGGGAAYAYWTVTGAGSGAVSTATSVSSIVVNQTSTITGLAPGLPAQVLSGTFTNNNDGSVYITSVTAAISGVTKAAGAPSGTCDASDYLLLNPTMPVAAEIPAGVGKGVWTGATIAFNNKLTTNQDACKGATVSVSYTAA